jgi:hypothetical protein
MAICRLANQRGTQQPQLPLDLARLPGSVQYKRQKSGAKGLIRFLMTYSCSAWEFGAETRLSKLQRLQKRILRTIGKFARRTSVCDLYVAFQIQYVYNYIMKMYRQQAEVIQNHE